MPPWGSAGHHTQISLNRLGHDDTRAIVQQRLGMARAPEEIVEAVVERSDGVPLFAEELARTLGERVVDSLSTEVPASLYDSVMARLDRLQALAPDWEVNTATVERLAWTVVATILPKIYRLAMVLQSLGELTAAEISALCGTPQ